MLTLTLVRGTSGSGKSTFVNEVFDKGFYSCFESDMFFMKYGKYEFDSSKLKQAHDWCQNEVETAMCYKTHVVVSNTFTTEWEMKPYIDLAEKYGYTVFTIVVEKRHDNKDIHGVPQETRKKQAERLSKSIKLI